MTAAQRNYNKSAPRSNKDAVFGEEAGARAAINVSSFERKDPPFGDGSPRPWPELRFLMLFDCFFIAQRRVIEALNKHRDSEAHAVLK